ncbi:MAG: hypothetical protein ACLTER_19990 [Ruminococcus sp.]
MPGAASALIRHGFEDLGMTNHLVWLLRWKPEIKARTRKIRLCFHHTCNEVPVPLFNEVRVGHTNVMTKDHWEKLYK